MKYEIAPILGIQGHTRKTDQVEGIVEGEDKAQLKAFKHRISISVVRIIIKYLICYLNYFDT